MDLSTNFNKKMLLGLNEVLKFAIENSYSSFYRDKYKNQISKQLNSYEDFQKIPLLEKDEFAALPLDKKTFVPEEKIAYYSISSGTTKSLKPTILPHSSFYLDNFKKYYIDEEQAKKMNAKKILLLIPPNPQFFKYFAAARDYIIPIQADIHNMRMAAGVAKEISIDGINTTPTILTVFIDYLKEIDFDLTSIKWLAMGAEFCSEQRAIYFKSIFPNAFFNFRYGSSETGMRGYRCKHLANNQPPKIFHLLPNALIEIMSEENKILPHGESGEIIYTALEPKAFPLIRYKTNDMAAIMEKKCACKQKHTIELGGRTNYDILKFSGTILNVEAIEKSLDDIRQYINTRFQMHVYEEAINGKLKTKLQLHLKLNKEFINMRDNLYFIENIRNKISKNLSLSTKSNLSDLVKKNLFLPLEVVFVNSWPAEGKAKNIISHLE